MRTWFGVYSRHLPLQCSPSLYGLLAYTPHRLHVGSGLPPEKSWSSGGVRSTSTSIRLSNAFGSMTEQFTSVKIWNLYPARTSYP